MKPTRTLLRSPLAPRAASAANKRVQPIDIERDVLVARKLVAAEDVRKLAAADSDLDKRLGDLVTALRRDTSGRPKPIPGAVAVRVVGASCGDERQVPLPNLQVTLQGTDGGAASAVTDVTGLAVLRLEHAEVEVKPTGEDKRDPQAPQKAQAAPPAAKPSPGALAYRLKVTASDGSSVAALAGDPSATHLVQLGESPALSGHAALGRGWLAALDKAEQRREVVTKAAAARLAEHLRGARTRLEAIERRLELHHKKA